MMIVWAKVKILNTLLLTYYATRKYFNLLITINIINNFCVFSFSSFCSEHILIVDKGKLLFFHQIKRQIYIMTAFRRNKNWKSILLWLSKLICEKVVVNNFMFWSQYWRWWKGENELNDSTDVNNYYFWIAKLLLGFSKKLLYVK